jgi:hypothetical protein
MSSAAAYFISLLRDFKCCAKSDFVIFRSTNSRVLSANSKSYCSSISKPFMKRKVRQEASEVRLFPSKKGWLSAIEFKQVAAISKISMRNSPLNDACGAPNAHSSALGSRTPDKPPALAIS